MHNGVPFLQFNRNFNINLIFQLIPLHIFLINNLLHFSRCKNTDTHIHIYIYIE